MEELDIVMKSFEGNDLDLKDLDGIITVFQRMTALFQRLRSMAQEYE